MYVRCGPACCTSTVDLTLLSSACAELLDSDGVCVAEWAQCGGDDFTGDGGCCCEADNVCMYKNMFYSQCRPADRPFETHEMGILPVMVDVWACPNSLGIAAAPAPAPAAG
jgi:Fungal cellulose binding domain